MEMNEAHPEDREKKHIDADKGRGKNLLFIIIRLRMMMIMMLMMLLCRAIMRSTPHRSGTFPRRQREPIPALARGRGFREPFPRQHRVQDGAVVRGLAGGHDDEDVRVVREPAQEDVELGRLGVHDQEPGRGGRGVRVPGGAVLEGLHDVREALVSVVDGVHVADVGGDRGHR